MKYRTICVAGVDGTGKSSTIEGLSEILGKDNSVIQYMGFRMWETEIAKRSIVEHKYKYPFAPFMFLFSLIHEMYYRVHKHRNSGKIVIYDRYVYEHVLFRKRIVKSLTGWISYFILKISFMYLFPKPDITFYLICPLDISFKRKNDINTEKEKEGLRQAKKILDDFYMNRKGVVVIDTSKQNQENVISAIYSKI